MTASPSDLSAPSRYAPRPAIDPRWARLVWPLAALAVLLLFDVLFIAGFFRFEVKGGNLYGALIDVFDRGAPVLLLSIGMTLVIATGGVDLSVGAIMAISGAIAASLVESHGMPAAVAAAIGASLVAGFWNGTLVAWLGIQPIIATLILMVMGRGVAQLIVNDQIVSFRNPALSYLGGGFLFGVPFSLTLVAAMLLATALLTRKTALGLFVESVGGSATASRYAGVNATGVKLMVYVFSGFCAGVAGLIPVADIGAADVQAIGQYLELDAILAVVIGGTALTGGRFSLIGSVVGALVIQTLTTSILMLRIDFSLLGRRFGPTGVRPEWTLVVKAVVIVVVCVLQSEAMRQRLSSMFKGRKEFAPPSPPVPTVGEDNRVGG